MERQFRTLDEFASLRTNVGNKRIDCRDAKKTFPGKMCDICGDGEINVVGEQCDDGNNLNQDGCSMTCLVEPGATCDASEPSNCTEVCGDLVLTPSE